MVTAVREMIKRGVCSHESCPMGPKEWAEEVIFDFYFQSKYLYHLHYLYIECLTTQKTIPLHDSSMGELQDL